VCGSSWYSDSSSAQLRLPPSTSLVYM
jgi:hypothetical protein